MNQNAASVFDNYNSYLESKVKLPRAPHYYPSMLKIDADKKVTLNPRFIDKAKDTDNVLNQPYGDDHTPIDTGLETLMEFNTDVRKINGTEDTSGSTKYNESWQNTEQEFSFNSPDTFEHLMEPKSNGVERIDAVGDLKNVKEGTLAKFVQRFREEPPQSRQERRQQFAKKNESEQFWWMFSSPSDASTPMASEAVISPMMSRIGTPVNYDKANKQTSGRLFGKDNDTDSETNRIQLRANKLLQLSESTLNSSLSSIPESNRQSAKKYESLVADFKKKSNYNPKRASLQSFSSSVSVLDHSQQSTAGLTQPARKTLTPESDILYQWRLSRKMELASLAVDNKNNAFLNRTKMSINSIQHRTSCSNKNNTECDERSNTPPRRSNNSKTLGHNFKGQTSEHGCSDSRTNQPMNQSNKESYEHTLTSNSQPANSNMNQNNRANEEENRHNELCINVTEIVDDVPTQMSQHQCGCSRRHEERGREGPQQKVPPHVHDICDILPCRHFEGVNIYDKPGKVSMQSSGVIDQRRLNNAYDKSADYKVQPTVNDKNDGKTKNNVVKPMIKKVISHHLFAHDESTSDSLSDTLEVSRTDLSHSNQHNKQADTCMITNPTKVSGKVSGYKYGKVPVLNKTPVGERSNRTEKMDGRVLENFSLELSSDEEFADDEILQELRNRRNINKSKLKAVENALFECSQQT